MLWVYARWQIYKGLDDADGGEDGEPLADGFENPYLLGGAGAP